MEKRKLIRYLLIASFFMLNSLLYTACKDEYEPDDNEPPRSVLAASVYDFLADDVNNEGPFTLFLRLADEVQIQGDPYTELLKRTGSNTLFVANDEAFNAFFADNDWGVSSFEELSDAQKKLLLKSAIINDAYSLDMLSSTPGSANNLPGIGESMRRTIGLDILDTIPFETGEDIPNNPYWERFQTTGVHVLKDNSVPTIVCFLAPFIKNKNITYEDFEIITGKTRTELDAFIYDLRVTSRDNYCKNGYVNVLDALLFPRDNMAEHLNKRAKLDDPAQSTKVFKSFLDRFCAPFFDAINTTRYRDLTGSSDSIFVKRYFVGETFDDPYDKPLVTTLPYDPGKNDYTVGNQSLQSDMAAMFVPSDAVLNEYFNNGEGRFLKERYGTWEQVPDNVILDLVNNHMRLSFLLSLPSKFTELEDAIGTNMGVRKEDVVDTEVCSNGVIYLVDKVYSPTEFVAVSAPVSLSENTRIFNWAITSYEFNLYLLSMEPGNVFSFFVPTDEALRYYKDPLSMASTALDAPEAEIWEFIYSDESAATIANVYDIANPTEVLRVVTNAAQIRSRLYDLLDNSIVVGNVEEVGGASFYRTKGYSTIKIVDREGTAVKAIQGGMNLEAEFEGDMNNAVATVTERVNNMPPPYGEGNGNGNTYFLDRIAAPSVKSVYRIMSENPEFSEFLNLCLVGVDKTMVSNPVFDELVTTDLIFETNTTYKDEFSFVKFFNAYHYTLYIPTNDELISVLNDPAFGIKTWQYIYDNIFDYEEAEKEIQKLTNFIRYHFQDNSIYADAALDSSSQFYQTATRNPIDDKFLKLKVKREGNSIHLFEENNTSSTPSAIITNINNIMARDIQFNSNGITTSSFTVIHQIDRVLDYRNSSYEEIGE